MSDDTKECKKCGFVKPLESSFYFRGGYWTGTCRDCLNAKRRKPLFKAVCAYRNCGIEFLARPSGSPENDRYCSKKHRSAEHARRSQENIRNQEHICAVGGCDYVGAYSSIAEVDGYVCPAHYGQWVKNGEFEDRKIAPVGARSITRDGYVLVKYETSELTGRSGWALEHRYIKSEELGRPLRDFENVHHINGVRSDNRPENLELWVKPQPTGQRVEDLAEWVVEAYPALVEAALSDRMQLRLVNE